MELHDALGSTALLFTCLAIACGIIRDTAFYVSTREAAGFVGILSLGTAFLLALAAIWSNFL